MPEYVRLAIVFMAGIYLSGRVSPSFALIFILSLILVLTIKVIFKRSFGIKILIMSLAFASGVWLCRYALDSDRLALSGYVDCYITATGRVSEIPYPAAGENNRYIVSLDALSYGEKEIKTNEKLLLTTPDVFRYGDTITFSGTVKKLPEKMNESGFDFARYYKTKGVHFKAYASSATYADYNMYDFSPAALGNYIKCFISDVIDKHYKGDYAAVLKAVLTGNKKEFSEELTSALDRTKLARFYYPAYLHVIFLVTILTAALSFLNKKKRDYATIIFLIIYALFNFEGFVALRLCIMLAIILFLKNRRGYVYYPDVLGITAIIMGVVNPLSFFDAGFAMSMFSCVLIYYFYDRAEEYFKFIGFKYVRRMVTVGVICSVGLTPICAYFWNYVSLHSICVSFIMIPCVGVILALSPVWLLMLLVFGAAPVVGWAVSAMVFILEKIPLWVDKLGFLGDVISKPSLLGFAIYFILLAALVKHIKKKKRQMYLLIFIAAALCVSVGIREIKRFNSIEMTFVNVGQGDGAIITAPYRYTVLIDGGGGNAYSDYDPGEALFLEYLLSENITKIDSAYVSHYHQDHVQGIIAAITHLRVRNVFMPDNMEGSEWRTKLEDAANEHGTKIHYLKEETLLKYDGGMSIHVIPPAPKTRISDDENDTTYVYEVSYGDFSALFTGDMSRFAEKNLINMGVVPKADLLKVAHHGSKTGTSPEWAAALKPRMSVISVGENNTYALPNEETLENLKDSIIYRTDYDGDIRFSIDKRGIMDIDVFNRRE